MQSGLCPSEGRRTHTHRGMTLWEHSEKTLSPSSGGTSPTSASMSDLQPPGMRH